MEKVKILLIEDHVMTRLGTAMVIKQVENFANSGTKEMTYTMNLLGDKFSNVFRKLSDGTVQLQSSINRNEVSTLVQAEQEKINKAVKDWQDDNKQMLTNKANDFATDMTQHLRDIGKKLGK